MASHVPAWQVMAQHGKTRLGKAWHGMAWHGKAWHGVVQLITAQQGTAWHTLPALVPPPELSLQPHSMQQISEPSAASEKPPKL